MSALRCLRCGGNLYTEADFGGHIIDIKCLSCGRSPAEKPRDAFLETVHDPRAGDGTPADPIGFLWHRP